MAEQANRGPFVVLSLADARAILTGVEALEWSRDYWEKEARKTRRRSWKPRRGAELPLLITDH